MHRFPVFGSFQVTNHVVQRTGQKTASATSRIKQNLARSRVYSVNHKSGHTAGRVVLTSIAGGLQIVQNLFIDVTKMLTLSHNIEVDTVDLVHHLAY